MLLKIKSERIFSEFLFQVFPLLVNKKPYANSILMYHGTDLNGNTSFNNRHAGIKCFKEHICYLKKYCNIISLYDFFNQKFDPGKLNVALTFDDGYKNNYKYALSVLEKNNVPASFFITGLNQAGCNILWADFLDIAGHLFTQPISIDGEKFENRNGSYYSLDSGKSLYEIIKKIKTDFGYKEKMIKAFSAFPDFRRNSSYFDSWQLMTDEEIIKASKSKVIEIGSHGYYHNNLGNIKSGDAKQELMLAKTYLENLIQKEVVSLAYPDGSYSREVIGIAENTGFKHQLAADGYLFQEDKTDSRIRARGGVYNCGQCGNQLFDALKLASKSSYALPY